MGALQVMNSLLQWVGHVAIVTRKSSREHDCCHNELSAKAAAAIIHQFSSDSLNSFSLAVTKSHDSHVMQS